MCTIPAVGRGPSAQPSQPRDETHTSTTSQRIRLPDTAMSSACNETKESGPTVRLCSSASACNSRASSCDFSCDRISDMRTTLEMRHTNRSLTDKICARRERSCCSYSCNCPETFWFFLTRTSSSLRRRCSAYCSFSRCSRKKH